MWVAALFHCKPTTGFTLVNTFFFRYRRRKNTHTKLHYQVGVVRLHLCSFRYFLLNTDGFIRNQIILVNGSVHFNLTLELINHIFPYFIIILRFVLYRLSVGSCSFRHGFRKNIQLNSYGLCCFATQLYTRLIRGKFNCFWRTVSLDFFCTFSHFQQSACGWSG